MRVGGADVASSRCNQVAVGIGGGCFAQMVGEGQLEGRGEGIDVIEKQGVLTRGRREVALERIKRGDLPAVDGDQ